MLKTRVATGQHWEFGPFRVGYWQQGCGRCEAPFYREASPKKRVRTLHFQEGHPFSQPCHKFHPNRLFYTGHIAKYCKTRETAISFQIKEIHCEHVCWRLGSLLGSTGNLGFSGWDIDNRVVDVVRHHSIERLPQKEKVRTLHFLEGYPFSQPCHKFHPNQRFYTGHIAKYCKTRETAISFQIKEIHCEHVCWRLGSLLGSTGNLGFSGWDIDNRVVDVVRRHSIERLPPKKTVRTLHFIEGYLFSQPRQKFHPNQPFYTGQIAKYCKNRQNCNFHFK